MEYVLRYRSSRAEVWRWYWRSWRTKFWWQHALIAASLACLFITPAASWFSQLREWGLGWLAMQLLVTLCFALWPQFKFKRSERLLTVGSVGWSTQIGATAGSRRWKEVAHVQSDGEAVTIVGTNGNALIVPSRAFPDAAQMQQFALDADAWHRAAHASCGTGGS